jgi:hypothetical protein
MPAMPQRLPFVGFLLWGILPAVFAVSALSRDPLGIWSNALGGFALAWWIVGGQLRHGRSRALVPAMLLIALPWAAALAQTMRRIAFVLREGALDGPDGYGSPMAFVLGVVFEQGLVFIPLTVIAVRLWHARRYPGARPAI